MSDVRDHQLDTLLHRGTHSDVWRAMRLGPNGFSVPVALKTLNEACADAPDQVRNFLRESRAAGSVQHKNVVQVRELIYDRGGYWISMELVRGWSMRALLDALETSGERAPIPVVLSLVRDAARGLQAIHEAGLVHRNVAPDNLMISSAGHLVVLDFGLATWQHAHRIRFTPPVDVLPSYASPELHSRLPYDARTDVYSLGALLDQLVPDRSDAPIALDAIVQRALDADPARRFPSAQALEVALDLVSIRENWLVPPSYVSAYVNDAFRTANPVVQRADVPPADDDIASGTPPVERRVAPPNGRAVLPRGRRGMVGVGAMLPSAPAKNDRVPTPDAPMASRSLASRLYTSHSVTRIRVRR